jgi:hypothetical protein
VDIYLLTDYKNRFGSRHFDKPYRSGFDQQVLAKYFSQHNINPKFINLSDVNFRTGDYQDKCFLYTSSEDEGYFYKSYIEDIVLGLQLAGARVIPDFKYLRANNNKVFMEILRDQLADPAHKNIAARGFGTYEEFSRQQADKEVPRVVKSAEGASGKNVYLASDKNMLVKLVKKVSRTKDIFYELWDLGRSFKHKGYQRDSRYRRKFIVQDFIPGLQNDWKMYVFGQRYYIFYRPIFKKRVFKASGGGYDNYYYGTRAPQPAGIFDFARSVYEGLKVPHVSLDIGYDGKSFYLFEFQCLYFGTAGILYSDAYYTFDKNIWQPHPEKFEPEKVYADSIAYYLDYSK